VGGCPLPTIHDTAYPRLKSSVSEKELNEIYTPTADEFDLAHSLSHSTAMRIGFLVLLKTFQRLGYLTHENDSYLCHMAHKCD
jgi:Domain of unknown function (DUF4158)